MHFKVHSGLVESFIDTTLMYCDEAKYGKIKGSGDFLSRAHAQLAGKVDSSLLFYSSLGAMLPA
jgi:hypothetical protein